MIEETDIPNFQLQVLTYFCDIETKLTIENSAILENKESKMRTDALIV